MYGLFVPDIGELRGLEAVGWLARQHELSVEAFLALVREVRTADERLPLLVTTYRNRQIKCPQRLEENWRLLESLSLRNRRRGRVRGVSPLGWETPHLRFREQYRIASQYRAGYLQAWRATIDRLSTRFRFDDH